MSWVTVLLCARAWAYFLMETIEIRVSRRGVVTVRAKAHLHDLEILHVFALRLDELANDVVACGFLSACGDG